MYEARRRAGATAWGPAMGWLLWVLSGCAGGAADGGANSPNAPFTGVPPGAQAGAAAGAAAPSLVGGTAGTAGVATAPAGVAGDGAASGDPSVPQAGVGDVGGAGAAAPAGAGGSPATAGAGPGAPPEGTDPPGAGPLLPWCVHNPSQVVIVGDSYINWGTHTLPADLAALAGEAWRLYAVGGASMASGGATGFIPDQLELAIAQDPDIRVVVMDGGGNDVLIPNALFIGAQDCKNNPNADQVEVCRMIVDLALEKSREMMLRAADIGVRDTVYFFYPEVPEGTVLGGTNPNAILNYSLPLAREACENAFEVTGGRMRCHFVDMIPVFAGKTGLFAPADIHPNTAGSALMAEAIWQVMTDNCVGQPESSGCCEP